MLPTRVIEREDEDDLRKTAMLDPGCAPTIFFRDEVSSLLFLICVWSTEGRLIFPSF